MKKKIWIPIVAVSVLLALLFVPVPTGTLRDGGTRVWTALTYKIVDWNRISNNGTYEKTRIYFGADRFRSIDELWEMEWENIEHSLIATVLEINGSSVLVEPVPGASELNSSGKISFSIEDMDIGAKVGDVVKVTYVGGIMETYPARIHAVRWEISTDLRHREYEGEWLDQETAEKYDAEQSSDLVITAIYSDCFFARYVIPMPYTVKVNGSISEKWCVGDQVLVTYNECYTDGNKMECELKTIEESTFQMEPGVAYKPVIYLYPPQEMQVSVGLALDGRLTCTYPAYSNGWTVTAAPDGTLTDGTGQTYNYLYWEGETHAQWDMRRGFCIKGGDTAAFLEDALARLGLTRREANEFIVFWLPLMQENPYNVISFQTDVYTDSAKLSVTPEPDTVIRVFMTFLAADSPVDIEPQVLTAPERSGFTVVEWGGAQIKNG